MIFRPFSLANSRFAGSLTLWLFGLILALSGCEPVLPAPDPLPIGLRVNRQPDSTLTAPNGLDFSTVSEIGQGPSGTMVRVNQVGAPHGNYTAYTYDSQSRLTGSCQRTSYGYNLLELVRYQGTYLAEVYTGIRYLTKPVDSVMLVWVTHYTYDDQNRLGQVLVYENVRGTFKLNQTIQYEYNAAGQLQLTRHAISLAYGSSSSYQGVYPSQLRYWEEGDNYRLETYIPNQAPVLPSERVYYNQVVNPLARLHLWPDNAVSTHYPIGSGISGPEREEYQYRFDYDGQGRLSSMQQRSIINYIGSIPLWTEWSNRDEFVYAP